MELEKELITALKDAEVAKEIAKNALEVATQALAKVTAMEKSTHKVTFLDPHKFNQIVTGKLQHL